jgi:hypothetical protein
MLVPPPLIAVARMNTVSVASGAVNRLGKNTPAAKPRAQAAATPAAPTATGHSGGPPQAPWRAVLQYKTATQAR